MTIAPLAIVTGIGLALLAGQIGAMMNAGSTGHLESDEGLEQVVENLVRDWHAADGDPLDIAEVELGPAFATLVRTDAYRKEHVDRATAVGEAWDAGEDPLWIIDLSGALQEAAGTLPPAAEAAIASNPIVDFGEFPSPGLDQLRKMAVGAMALAIAVLALTLYLSRNPYFLSIGLALMAPFALLPFWLLRDTANSADPTTSALAEWVQQRFQLPVLMIVGFSIAMAVLALANRPLRLR